MITINEYHEALLHLRRFIDDTDFRKQLGQGFKGFALAPEDILIEELATIGLRCLEAKGLADGGPAACAVFPDGDQAGG